MKKLFLLLGLFFVFSAYVCGQTKPDFSGNWTLDKSQSTLDPEMRIESSTLSVTQTVKEITVTTTITREPPSEGNRSTVSGGNGTSVYPLDGKEITIERESFRGKIPVKVKGEFLADGKLSLNASQTGISNGVEFISTVKSVWELSANGKILKINRTINNPKRGDITTEMVYTKN